MTKQLRIWVILIGLIFLVAGLSFALIAYWIGQLDISKIENPLPEPSYIYDRYDNLAVQLSSSPMIPVSLEMIPKDLRNAIITVEDRRFYEHRGVDFGAIARALWKDIQARDFVEGGSTITQQLAKNLFLSSEKSIKRKIMEAAYAIKIDLTYDKDQILELYLNQIYFGEGAWGVASAAQFYFGKSVQDLTLAESALLAGLPKSPNNYSPVKNKEKAIERRNLILSLMLEQGFINTQSYEQARAEEIHTKEGYKNPLKGKYPSYVDAVIEEAIKKYGFTEEEILTGGLRIYTELDPKVQQSMEDVYKDDRFFPASSTEQPIQSAAVVLDPYTGAVRGIIGNRGDHVFRGFHRGTQLKRQPGSTIKPLVVYGPAIEKGYTPYTFLYDGPLNIQGYQPTNYDGRTRGKVTLYEAIIKSWNIPAVWLLNEIGIETGIAYGQKLGLSLTKQDRNLGLALGGLYEGVSPLQMAQAYSVFPNLGKREEAYFITKITSKIGDHLVAFESKPMEVMKPNTAYTMTLLLQEVVTSGTGRNAALPRPTAGKTGTTQLPESKEFAGKEGVKDAWFVGYTPEYVAAVWMGYDQTDAQHIMNITGGSYPAMVFKEILSRSLTDAEVTAFKKPDNYQIAWTNPYIQKEKEREKNIKEIQRERAKTWRKEQERLREQEKKEEKKRRKKKNEDDD